MPLCARTACVMRYATGPPVRALKTYNIFHFPSSRKHGIIIIFSLSHTHSEYTGDIPVEKELLIFVGIEHFMLLVAWIIHKGIPDRPKSVRTALARADYESSRALKREVSSSSSKCKLIFSRFSSDTHSRVDDECEMNLPSRPWLLIYTLFLYSISFHRMHWKIRACWCEDSKACTSSSRIRIKT